MNEKKMTKRLIYVTDTTLVVPPLIDIVEDYFQVEKFGESNVYDENCIFILQDDTCVEKVAKYDNKKIIDALMETHSFVTVDVPNSNIIHGSYRDDGINVPEWFWYREALSYCIDVENHYGEDKPYSFLMPIRMKKPHRDLFVARLKNNKLLDDARWSYVAEGKCLEDEFIDDRHYDSSWYSETNFTLVVETYQQSETMFITEKTFKPIQYKHPFIIFGIPGTLNKLREMGFETFDNIFDESYDEIEDIDERIDVIMQNLSPRKIYTAETIRRIDHNYRLFNDKKLVQRKVKDNIIQPILEYVND